MTWLFALVMLLVDIASSVCLLLLEPPHKVDVSYDVDGPVASSLWAKGIDDPSTARNCIWMDVFDQLAQTVHGGRV